MDSFSFHALLRKPWGIASIFGTLGIALLWYGCKPWSSAILQAFSALVGIAFLIIAARGPMMAKGLRRRDFFIATRDQWDSPEAAAAAIELHESIGAGVDPGSVRWETFVNQVKAAEASEKEEEKDS